MEAETSLLVALDLADGLVERREYLNKKKNYGSRELRRGKFHLNIIIFVN